MGKTIIIVEDNNDKYTYEAIINFMTLQNELSVDSSEIDIEWKPSSADANPLKPNGLINTLINLQNDFKKGKFNQIGIVWDLDIMTNVDRIKMIKLAIESAYQQAEITLFDETNKFGTIIFDKGKATEIEIRVAYHFVGLNNKGEIEDLLKAIKSKPSPLADCVNNKLPICLKELSIDDLRDKDLVKLWINNYQRYDTLLKDNRNAKFTKWENIMKHRSDIFNFNNDNIRELVELKEFLKMMSNNNSGKMV